MSITNIPNQPVTFTSVKETDSSCNNAYDRDYCTLFNHTDELNTQWIIPVCSDDYCNEPFVGEELVVNGTFDGNADGWGFSTGWEYDTNKMSRIGLPNNEFLSQAFTQTAGTVLSVTFTISGRTAGDLRIKICGADPANTGTTRSADGIYTETLTVGSATPFFWFAPDAGGLFDGSIEFVSISQPNDCWSTEGYGFDWSLSSAGACHTPGYTSGLVNSSTVVAGNYYRVVVTISGSTAGTVAIYLGGNVAILSGDGDYVRYITAGTDDNAYMFVPTTDFDGCLSDVSIVLLPSREDWQITLVDMDGNFVEDIQTAGTGSPNVYYHNNYATLKWGVPQHLIGCYKIVLSGGCEDDNTNCNPDFIDDICWTPSDSQVTLHPGYAEYLADAEAANGNFNIKQYLILNSSCEYEMEVTFAKNENTPGQFLSIALELWTNAYGSLLQSAAFISTAGTETQTVRAKITCDISLIRHFKINCTLDNFSEGYGVKIYSAKITPLVECDNSYESNCINIAFEQDCAVLVEASCCGVALGFDFTDFTLRARYKALFMNPVAKNQNENYLTSAGAFIKSFSERQKIFDLLFNYVDEIAHDAINTALVCDTLTISDVDYVWLEDSYKPDWDREGRLKLAQSRVQIERKEGHVTNNNSCAIANDTPSEGNTDADCCVQSDWDVTDIANPAYIKHKPTIPSGNGLINPGYNYYYVEATTDALVNGTALLDAYANAALLEPGGNILSATNRAVVILMPGVYDLGTTTLTMSSFVDLVGWDVDRTHTTISMSAGADTIYVPALADVHIINLTLYNNDEWYTYFSLNWEETSILSYIKNCRFLNFQDGISPSMHFNKKLNNSYFEDCVATGELTFGRIGIDTCTFIRCEGDIYAWGQGAVNNNIIMIGCKSKNAAFQSAITGNSLIKDCEFGTQLFADIGADVIIDNIKVPDTLRVTLAGTLKNSTIKATGAGEPGITNVVTGARIEYCKILGNGTGKSIQTTAGSAQNVQIIYTATNKGFGANITNTITTPLNIDDPALV